MGLSIKGFAQNMGYSGSAGSAEDACGLRFLSADSLDFRMEMTGPFSCGSPEESWETIPSWLSVVDHPCEIPFCGFLGCLAQLLQKQETFLASWSATHAQAGRAT